MSRRKGFGRRCSFELPSGETCRAFALRESDPPLCRVHAMTPEELSASGRRMANVQAVERRAKVEPAPQLSGLDPRISLAEVLDVVRPALTATLPTREPDWSARLAGAGTLLAAFPRYFRDTPERVRELLERVLPADTYDPVRMDASKVYSALRAEWDKLDGLGWSDITGLYVKPYPAWVIAPWEDADKIQRGQPKPPDQARVHRLPDGRAMLERPGELPLLLRPDEEGGGLIRASTILL